VARHGLHRKYSYEKMCAFSDSRSAKLTSDQKALYLPDILGKSLDEGIGKNTTTMCFGRITVLAMLGTKISEVGRW
jgi:hypothetical protein